MKLRLKFDQPKIKISHNGKAEAFGKTSNYNEPALIETDLDLLNIAYPLFPQNITSFLNKIHKTVNQEDHKEIQRRTNENIGSDPGIIPVTGNDIFNYIARYGMANFQIQVVMKLEGRLDPGKLKKAVRLSMDAEPVFGCRFVEGQPPYWKRRENLDSIKFCTVVKSKNPDKSTQDFLESPLDMDHDPMVRLKLIQSGSKDTLCLKINHTCCDGTGVKEYLQLLSNIYSRLDKGDGNFTPKPSNRSRIDQDRLLNALGIKDPEAIRDPKKETPKTLWAFPWRSAKPEALRSAICQLPAGYVDILSRNAKAKGASINDWIVTGIYRAMFEVSHPFYGVPMDIPMTVDLRRYLPNQKTEAIRNFSGGFITSLARLMNEPFEGTLSRVVTMMNRIKNGYPGVQSAVGLEFIEKCNFFDTKSYYQKLSKPLCQYAGYIKLCTPVLSNLGVLDKSLFRFGKTVAADAFIVPPALCAPGLLFCIGSYNGIMTIAVSYYESQVRKEVVEGLLDLIRKELMENCKT
ncbi:MAG: condensation domain-containing protein [Clostridia bacterium]|nr:condensation domain-containing protein [Clostridia bacterium]